MHAPMGVQRLEQDRQDRLASKGLAARPHAACVTPCYPTVEIRSACASRQAFDELMSRRCSSLGVLPLGLVAA